MKRTLKVGLIGYNFMGKAHSNAWRQAPRFFGLLAEIEMNTICGRNRSAVRRSASRLGWKKSQTDWRALVANPEIDIIDICTHCDIAIAAARTAKQFCARNRWLERSRKQRK